MKDKTEYNGLESYVASLIQNENISWMPIERSFAIEKKTGRRHDLMKDIETLNGTLSDILNVIDPTNEQKARKIQWTKGTLKVRQNATGVSVVKK